MTREMWVLGVQLAAAFRCVSTIYQSSGNDQEYTPDEIEELVEFVLGEIEDSGADAFCLMEKMHNFLSCLRR